MDTLKKTPEMGNDVLSVIEKVIYTAGIVTGFWKAVDAVFAYRSKRQKEFVSDVVQERLEAELRPLRDAINEIKRARETDNRFQHEQFQNILTELGKIRNNRQQ